MLFPAPGSYRTGPFELGCNSSVTVIEEGATILSLNSTTGWPLGLDCPEPSQGLTSKQAAPLMLLRFAFNVTVTGGGTVDAGGAMWWREHCGNWWCPPGSSPRAPPAWRPFLFRIDSSSSVSIHNITFLNPGFWALVPVHSRDISISETRVQAPGDSPNTDGIEPMWSRSVTIKNCTVANGDDCVAVKSGSTDVFVDGLRCEHRQERPMHASALNLRPLCIDRSRGRLLERVKRAWIAGRGMCGLRFHRPVPFPCGD